MPEEATHSIKYIQRLSPLMKALDIEGLQEIMDMTVINNRCVADDRDPCGHKREKERLDADPPCFPPQRVLTKKQRKKIAKHERECREQRVLEQTRAEKEKLNGRVADVIDKLAKLREAAGGAVADRQKQGDRSDFGYIGEEKSTKYTETLTTLQRALCSETCPDGVKVAILEGLEDLATGGRPGFEFLHSANNQRIPARRQLCEAIDTIFEFSREYRKYIFDPEINTLKSEIERMLRQLKNCIDRWRSNPLEPNRELGKAFKDSADRFQGKCRPMQSLSEYAGKLKKILEIVEAEQSRRTVASLRGRMREEGLLDSEFGGVCRAVLNAWEEDRSEREKSRNILEHIGRLCSAGAIEEPIRPSFLAPVFRTYYEREYTGRNEDLQKAISIMREIFEKASNHFRKNTNPILELTTQNRVGPMIRIPEKPTTLDCGFYCALFVANEFVERHRERTLKRTPQALEARQ